MPWIAEALLVILFGWLAWARPDFAGTSFRAVEQSIARLANRPALALGLIGLCSLLLSAGLGLVTGMRPPVGHDSYSYLLAADTFAQGRLTNPTPPCWQHFESFHIILQPTYASKYPPMQGLFLALGQVLTGHPLAGVWISTALACVAMTWMLGAWMPARWALVGGFLTVLHPELLTWSTWYMGGSVALGAGALVLGAWSRLVDEKFRLAPAAWLLGIGLVVLANTRPFEGLAFTGGLALASLWMAFSNRPVRSRFMASIGPLVIALAIGACGMGYYNWRVTGDPFVMPYLVHERAYAVAPFLIWQSPHPIPAYRHEPFRVFHLGKEYAPYAAQQSFHGWLHATGRKLAILAEGAFPFYTVGLPMWLLIGLIPLAPAVLRLRRMPVVLFLIGFSLVATLQVTWINVYYAAPALGLVALWAVQSLRCLRAWHWHGRPCGRFLSRLSVLSLAAALATILIMAAPKPLTYADYRSGFAAKLSQTGQRHLIIVRYSPQHDPEQEWVYNGADIANSPVIWAREMDAESDRQLLQCFKDRQAWLLEADLTPPHLVPYPNARE